MATAVIITGNPKYVSGNPAAVRFYKEIHDHLVDKGYSVSFDPGEPFTRPKPADLWVGHSRGASRLQWAPKGTATVGFGVEGGVNHPKDKSLAPGTTPDKYHYILTDEMRAALGKGKTAASVYDPPMSVQDVRKKYPALLKDPTHHWRATKGVELIHKEPTRAELERIWANWQLMSPEQKKLSDQKSRELFGMTNAEHYSHLTKTAMWAAFVDEMEKISSMMPFYRGMGLANKVENVGLKRKGQPTVSEQHIGRPLKRTVDWVTGE